MTTGALVVIVDALLGLVVIASVYLFDVLLLVTLGGEETGNKSIIIGPEADPDGRL